MHDFKSVFIKAKAQFVDKLQIKREVKFPSFWQLIQFPSLLSKKERILSLSLMILFLASFSFLLQSIYNSRTVEVPTGKGQFAEGVFGYPRFITPVYAEA